MTDMSVFYHNDDPLLTRSIFSSTPQSSPNTLSDTYAQMYKQQLMTEMQQSQQQPKDWLSELDSAMKSLEPAIVEKLVASNEYNMLSTELQELIQAELMVLVKYKINANITAVDNIKKQIEIINKMSQEVKQEEKQNINELNDYLKNYSHLSFNEYKKLKHGTQEENEVVETVTTTSKKNKTQARTIE
jgi:hypothetical protein